MTTNFTFFRFLFVAILGAFVLSGCVQCSEDLSAKQIEKPQLQAMVDHSDIAEIQDSKPASESVEIDADLNNGIEPVENEFADESQVAVDSSAGEADFVDVDENSIEYQESVDSDPAIEHGSLDSSSVDEGGSVETDSGSDAGDYL